MYEIMGGLEFADIAGEEDNEDALMGYADLVGAGGGDDVEALLAASMGYADLVGAGSRGPSAIKRALMARKLAGASRLVRTRGPTKSREYPLGFGPRTIPAGGTLPVSAQPQVPFRGERLVIPSTIAPSFSINDVKVGKNSQFASSDPVPAVTFVEGGFGVRLQMDTAQVSQLVSIIANNFSGADADFRATIIGSAVE